MPPNGHALALEFGPDELEAAVAPNPAAAAPIEITPAATAAPTKPDAGSRPIRIDIGELTAAAAAGLACGLGEYWDAGCTTPETKSWGGERIAVLAVALLYYTGPNDDDFLCQARVAGRHELRQRFDRVDSDFFQAYSVAEADAALDYYIDSALEIVVRVVTAERQFRAMHAN